MCPNHGKTYTPVLAAAATLLDRRTQSAQIPRNYCTAQTFFRRKNYT